MTTLEICVEDTRERRPVKAYRHGAQFVVSLGVLADILCLPEGARVVSVTGGVIQQTVKRTVIVMVEHPDLPEVVEGAIPVEITPTFEWCDQAGKEILTDWGFEF